MERECMQAYAGRRVEQEEGRGRGKMLSPQEGTYEEAQQGGWMSVSL